MNRIPHRANSRRRRRPAEPELTGSGRWAPPPTASSPATASSRPRRTSPTSTATPSAASRSGALPHQLGVLTVPRWPSSCSLRTNTVCFYR
ncbi:hypothetical protein MUK42_35217 [Musa troglodytarum]|uniref:Uncharacterized protein n=1 Tax=Musa troglodytarum TaxID=320322 RepID=A0A9E7JC13_9LILI|nr:hypothetical protein MUK42_35217 [Musa troglodytarum]